jgi:hypothetical protein
LALISGFLISIKGLAEASGTGCKSLHQGSIPGETFNPFVENADGHVRSAGANSNGDDLSGRREP